MAVTSARLCSIAELELCNSININIDKQHQFWKSGTDMTPALPDDILHVLCEELANLRQFDTLFNCACASRVLAVPALTNLYRYTTWNPFVYSMLIIRTGHITKHQFEVVGTMPLFHSVKDFW